VLKTLLSVLNIDKPHKDGTRKSESEIRMCDRMQMYNIMKPESKISRTEILACVFTEIYWI
jgi:hypothetical protein